MGLRSGSPLIALGFGNNPLLSIGRGHANADTIAIAVTAYDSVTILANMYHGVSAPVSGGCLYLFNVNGWKFGGRVANAPQTAGIELGVQVLGSTKRQITGAEIGVYSDGINNSIGVSMTNGSTDLTIDAATRIFGSNSGNKIADGVFCQTANSGRDDLRIIGTHISNAGYPVYTVDGHNIEIINPRYTDCTNTVAVNAGTPVNVTETAPIAY